MKSSSRFFLKLAFITAVGLFISLYPGFVSVEWLGYHLTMPVAVFLCVFFVFLALFLWVYRFSKWVSYIPEKSRFYLEQKRLEKFDNLIIQGICALAAQDLTKTALFSKLAMQLQPHHPLAYLLRAQHYQAKGDYGHAEMLYKKMTDMPALKFIGIKGLLTLQSKETLQIPHNMTSIESHLLQLYCMAPQSPWVLQQLSQLYWQKTAAMPQDARIDILKSLPFYQHLTPKEARAHQGLRLWIVLTHTAVDDPFYSHMLIKAHTLLPENPVIAVTLSRYYHKNNQPYKAKRVLYTTFKRAPHRLIAHCFLDLSSHQDVLSHYQTMKKLCHLSPPHEECAWLLGFFALKAHLWGQARDHLRPLLSNPTKEICALMIELEQQEYPDEPLRTEPWRAKCATAPSYAWHCQKCHVVGPGFSAQCPHCHQFASMTFGRMPHSFSHLGDSVTQPLPIFGAL